MRLFQSCYRESMGWRVWKRVEGPISGNHSLYLLMLLESYQQFVREIAEMSFSLIEGRFKEFSQEAVNKWLPQYVPRLHEYSLQFDQHQREEEKMKNVPSFNGKKTYHNNENLHRRVITLFKGFLASEHKDIREFLRLSIDLDQLSSILSKIEILRFKSAEFNLLYFLFTASRKTIRIFLKLREEIIKASTFERNRFLPISTHNQAKYVEKYAYLDSVQLPQQQWAQIVNLAGFEYDQQFMKLAFSNSRAIGAVQMVQYCLWLNRQYALTLSPQKS